jgi:hypothetical protein
VRQSQAFSVPWITECGTVASKRRDAASHRFTKNRKVGMAGNRISPILKVWPLWLPRLSKQSHARIPLLDREPRNTGVHRGDEGRRGSHRRNPNPLWAKQKGML